MDEVDGCESSECVGGVVLEVRGGLNDRVDMTSCSIDLRLTKCFFLPDVDDDAAGPKDGCVREDVESGCSMTT